MAKKTKLVQVMAFLALFGIVIGIIGTGLLTILGAKDVNNQQSLTPEEYSELQKMVESQSGNITENSTGNIDIIKNLSGSIESLSGNLETSTGKIE